MNHEAIWSHWRRLKVLPQSNDKSEFLEFFKKMGQPRPLFNLFSVFFKQTIQFLQQINVKKCPSSIQSGIQTHDLQNMSLLQ